MKISEAIAGIPDLLLRSRFSFTFDEIPVIAEGLSFRQKENLVRCGTDGLLKGDKVRSLPPIVQIEPANVCNLRCPLCPTGMDCMNRDKGLMTMETFRRIMDQLGDFLVTAILYGWGEPFLNRDLLKMIRICSSRNITTMTSTNGHCLQSLDEALEVVDSGLSSLVIALDGSTQEIYHAYRKSGDVEKVKRCAALIEEAKTMRKSPLPYTNLRIVVTSYNADDLPNVERIARDVGVNMFSLKTVGCMPHSETYGRYEADAREKRRFGEDRDHVSHQRCPFPFRQPTIFWDGTVVGCEFDYDLEMPLGNINTGKFREFWNSSRAAGLRNRVLKGKQDGFCGRCPYRGRVRDGSVISRIELRPL